MNTLAMFLDKMTIGQPQLYANMAVYPLHVQNGHQRPYQTLDEALATKTLEVNEVSENGSVPSLMVHNRGDKPVLLVVGEELVGAKQNRVLNTSLLVAAHSDLQIPVSCVERGRWAYRSRNFDASVTTSHFKLRKVQVENVTKSLRSTGDFDANQRDVWREVDQTITRTGSTTTTSALNEVFKQSEAQLQAYIDAFPAPDAQGVIIAIDGAIVGGDVFDHAETLQALWPKLLRSYALDALERNQQEKQPRSTPAALIDTKQFMTHAQNAHHEIYELVGLGSDIRVSGDQVTGSGLVWNDQLVHASLFSAKA